MEDERNGEEEEKRRKRMRKRRRPSGMTRWKKREAVRENMTKI